MPWWLLILVVAVVLLIAIALGVLVHSGVCTDIRIRTSIPASLPRRVAYSVHRGPYSKMGDSFSDLTARAPRQTLFGAFYDDPDNTPPAECRYIVGCVLPESKHSPLEKSLKASDYSVWTFPECGNAVITEFPQRSFVSCMVAPRVVYPALKKYFKEMDIKCLGPVLEMYMDDIIRYIVPLENIEGFFVPEVAQQQESKKKL